MPSREHAFHAVAFAENLTLKELGTTYPDARRCPYELAWTPEDDRGVFLYPFGVIVFQNLAKEDQDRELQRLRAARPDLSTPVIEEDLVVREEPGAQPGMASGVLVVDRLAPARAGIVALTVAQSASMEYYEGIVEDMLTRMNQLVDRLEQRGTVPIRTRPLHKFIGKAVGTRNEALTILHLLDKPDAAWDDPAMDEIYDDLRAEFDLMDRFAALEAKLRAVQEALELILDVARDRRLVLLEATIVALILVEIVMSILRAH
jgi:uncharacterized Rmd1/YagE family protein